MPPVSEKLARADRPALAAQGGEWPKLEGEAGGYRRNVDLEMRLDRSERRYEKLSNGVRVAPLAWST